MLDTGETILEVTVRSDATVSFVLYRTPGDKNNLVSVTVPAPLQVAGHAWATHLQAAPAGIGDFSLDIEWSCDG
jgi:hypothetical protein